ncbi:MAG: ABC transporter permease [Firmicutes bacterium]|nr:ABC transporter permease [Bacillota bacterium]
MKLSSFRYIVPQAFKSMLHNGLMTVAAILTITISLFLCTAFWLLIINIDANARQVEEDVRVLAYLKEDIPDGQEEGQAEAQPEAQGEGQPAALPEAQSAVQPEAQPEIEPEAQTEGQTEGQAEEEQEKQLEEKYAVIRDEIMAIPGVASCEFISKEEGIKDLGSRFGGVDLKETLGGANPLPDLFSIMAETTDDVAVIAEKVSEIEAVDVVRYGEGTVEKLFALTDAMRRVGVAVMILLALAAVVLIAMTIRLAVVARKKEIMVMKWVGATNAFIRLPFLLEGVFLGLLGGLLALVLVLIAYVNAGDYLASTISFVLVLDIGQIWLKTAGFTLAAGLILGIFGSLFPLANRFMDV